MRDFSPELNPSPASPTLKFRRELPSVSSAFFRSSSYSSVRLRSSAFSFRVFSLALRIITSRPAAFSNSSIFSSDTFSLGSRLYLKVPLYKVGSCGIIVIFSLSYRILMSPIFTPSIFMLPPQTSTILVNARLRVLFPAPVLPTTPIFCPPLMFKLSFLRTISVFGLY